MAVSAALERFLTRGRVIGLDTNVFIYQLEANPKYQASTHHVFKWLAEGKGRAVTSTITLTELLVPSYRAKDVEKVNELYALLSTFPNLTWVPADTVVCDVAAKVRGEHGLRTPDAIQAATALATGATGFIANDPVFRRIPGMDAMILDDLIAPEK